MPLNIDSAAMLRLGRRFVALSLTTLAVGTGCSENASTPSGPASPVPKVHAGGVAPPAPVPVLPLVSPPGLPMSAVAEALMEPEFFARAEKLAALIPQLGPEALPDVKLALERMDVNTQIIEVALLAKFWAHHEPAEATRWSLFKAPAAYTAALMLPTMTEWARVDPFAAMSELEAARVIPGANSVVMEIALVRGWFHSETPGLEDYIRGLGVGQSRQRALRALIRATIDEYGPEHAIEWVEQLEDDDYKFRLAGFRQVALELGTTHLKEAVGFCDEWCDDAEIGKGLRKHIAQQWGLQDGRSAMDFVEKSPDNAETAMAAKWAFRGWYKGDREGLRSWLDEMGPEGVPDWMQPMLELTAVDLGKLDPMNGLAWAREIKNDADRLRTITTVLTNWRRKNPEEADAWLAQTNLPEDLLERVRYYGRPAEEVRADPNPGPGKIRQPRMRPRDTELAEIEAP